MRTITAEFMEHKDAIMSNFDHRIDAKVAEEIKGKKMYSQYAGWNFCGYVWYENDQWSCEVWTYKTLREVISAKSLEEIREKVCGKYGSD